MKIEEILNKPFTFTKRKNFTPCDSRPLWKASLIILIIGITGKNYCASLKKIHIANWVTKETSHLNSFIEWSGKAERKRPNVRLEPAIDRVIDLLVANTILEKKNGSINLTTLGIDIFNELNASTTYFNEKSSLNAAKKFINDSAIQRLFEGV